MNNKFTWIDISTFNVEGAKNFYQAVFDWKFSKERLESYLICSKEDSPCAGLYEMPDFFQKIKMPSFWMSYIKVEDIEVVVDKAKKLGGKIELEEQGEWGKVALIRDPSGAGFTCHEGGDLQVDPSSRIHGRWYHNELFVSDVSLVKPFYEDLFTWYIKAKSHNRYLITDDTNETIATIQVATNDVKGDKEFWAVYFTVDNFLTARKLIEKMGGNVIYEHNNIEGKHLLVHDNQGAAFFLSENKTNNQEKNNRPSATIDSHFSNSFKWKSFIGLLVLYFVMLTEQQWGYGIFWLMWVILDIKRGNTYFFDSLDKHSNPVLYWTVILTWLLVAVYYFSKV